MLDDSGLKAEKLDPSLREILREAIPPDTVNVIIQTVDGLKDSDKDMLSTLRGTFKDDLWLIKAFSAEIPTASLETLILSPRVTKVFLDGDLSR